MQMNESRAARGSVECFSWTQSCDLFPPKFRDSDNCSNLVAYVRDEYDYEPAMVLDLQVCHGDAGENVFLIPGVNQQFSGKKRRERGVPQPRSCTVAGKLKSDAKPMQTVQYLPCSPSLHVCSCACHEIFCSEIGGVPMS